MLVGKEPISGLPIASLACPKGATVVLLHLHVEVARGDGAAIWIFA
jgi:hypothetical protein